jgi:hypothetical protein
MTKLEIAMNKLETVFTQQKLRANNLITEHKQLQEALADMLCNADEDCPSDYRTDNFRYSLKEGYRLLKKIGYFKKQKENNDKNNN